MENRRTVGVIGATGYVGGRLVGWLADSGHYVRAFGLDMDRMRARDWAGDVALFEGSLLDPSDYFDFLGGLDILYVLIPVPLAEEAQDAFWDRYEQFAHHVAEVGVHQVVLLTASGDPDAQRKVSCFRRQGVHVVRFSTAPIIGSGSRLFELIRSSTERSPIVLMPAWAHERFHAVSVRTALQYLIHVLDLVEPEDVDMVIGSKVPTTFKDLVEAYARIRQLRRWFIPVPGNASYHAWLSMMTPLPGSIVRRTLSGMRDSVGYEPDEHDHFNVPELSSLSAIRFALQRFASDSVATSWTDALPDEARDTKSNQRLGRRNEMISERIELEADVPRDRVFRVLSGIGGDSGWPYANALWRMRGFLDVVFGGVGLRAARRSSEQLRVGDSVDFWRVEAIEEGHLLRFRAEMKLPGRAWLQFELADTEKKGTRIVQTAFYDPHGVMGRLYWYAMYVPHLFIFPGLIRRIVDLAQNPS